MSATVVVKSLKGVSGSVNVKFGSATVGQTAGAGTVSGAWPAGTSAITLEVANGASLVGSVVVKTKTLFAGEKNDLSLPLNTGGEIVCEITIPDEDDSSAGEGKVAANDDLDEEFASKVNVKAAAPAPAASMGDDEDDDEAITIGVETASTEQAMAIKPFLGALVAPSGYKPAADRDSVPAEKLQLEYVWGYRAHDCRNNLFVAQDDPNYLLYNTAALGVRFQAKNKQQTFFNKHTDDVISFAYNPARGLLASGQMGKTPSIYVYNAKTMQLVAGPIQGFHKRAVVALSFSEDGALLASVGDDDDHSVAVYDTTTGALVASGAGDKNRVLHVRFCGDSKAELVTFGVKHVKFWTLAGRALTGKKGMFGQKGEIQTIACGEHTKSGYTVSGTASGDLYLWKAGKIVKVIEAAHAGPVLAMTYVPERDFLATGGRDGQIKVWNTQQWKAETSHKVGTEVRAIAVGPSGQLFAGTKRSEIVDVATGNVVMVGHFGEAWGLEAHPSDTNTIVTAGDDGTVRLFNVAQRSQVSIAEFPNKDGIRGVAVSPDGSLVALGFQDGSVSVVSAKDPSKVVWTKKDSARQVDIVRFSPNGALVACGSHDTMIRVYDAAKGSAKFTCKGHHSTITHVDFSADSSYLQSNSLDYELLFWSMTDGSQLKSPSALKDVQWATWTCVLGWPVQGIFPPYHDFTDVNAVSRSHNGKVLATADDMGTVRLMRYPAIGSGYDHRGKIAKRPDASEFRGHSSHVTNVSWAADDSKLFSIGGNDRSIFVWKVL
jgi:microtubule-associated protein-like 6